MPIIAIVLGLAIIAFGSYLIINKDDSDDNIEVTRQEEATTTNSNQNNNISATEVAKESVNTETESVEVQPIHTENDIITPVKDTKQNTESGQSTSPSDTKPITQTSKTYTDEETYRMSDNIYTIDVTLEVSNGVVKSADVMYDNKETGYQHPLQERFDAVYKTEVIGKKLEDINLSRVGGASLTSKAFNKAVAEIITQTNT